MARGLSAAPTRYTRKTCIAGIFHSGGAASIVTLTSSEFVLVAVFAVSLKMELPIELVENSTVVIGVFDDTITDVPGPEILLQTVLSTPAPCTVPLSKAYGLFVTALMQRANCPASTILPNGVLL